MPKAISIPPTLNQADIPKNGAEVTITEVREVVNQFTSIGTMKHGLACTVDYDGDEYSQMFSLDKEILTGSIGRILVAIGIEDTDIPDFSTKIQTLVGKKIRVQMKGGKLYWYP